jgi:hypothetical protein
MVKNKFPITVGFGSANVQLEEHRDYLNKPAHFQNQTGIVHGVYIGTETDKYGISYALFKPSVIYDGHNRAILDNTNASKLMMPLVVIRPLATSLEQYVDAMNTYDDRAKTKK